MDLSIKTKMRFRTLRSQILFFSIVPLWLLGMIGLAYLAVIQHQMLNQSLAEYSAVVARYAAMASEYALIAEDPSGFQEIAKRAMREGEVAGFTVTNSIGDVVFTSGMGPKVSTNTLSVTRPVTSRFVAADGKEEEKTLGEVTLVIDKTKTRQEQMRAVALPLMLMLVMLIAAWRIGLRLSRQVASPVEQIIKAMNAIGSGNFGMRVPETARNELVDLEKGINTMAAALQSMKDGLEAHVAAATADYARANAELEVEKKQLEYARVVAEEATRSKSQFLANMSHEIRTPLNSIIGYTQLVAREGGLLPSKTYSHFQSIEVASKTMLELVTDILDFSKIEAGKVTQSIETFDLLAMLDAIAAQFAHQIQAKALYLDTVVYFDVPRRLSGDRTHLSQILVNLISNAIKFTQEGGVVIRVSLDEERVGNRAILMFEVDDTGEGVPVEDQGRLFLPFEQLDASTKKRYKGTGLGLAICKSLVTLLGGRIGVRSAEQAGTTFWFAVPVNVEPALIPPMSNKRIGVLDTRLSYRQAVFTHLADRGFAPICSSSIEGLSDATDMYDVVFTRWKGMSTTAREIAELKRLSSAIVVGMDAEHPEVESLQQPGVIFISGPTRSEILQPALIQSLKLDPPERKEPILDRRGTFREGMRVLVVDDNELNRIYMKELLSIYGVQILEEDNGRDAVKCVSGGAIDIVLMDLHMPGMDGRETARIIRESGSNVPIIAVTANALAETAREVRTAGMNDLVTKPVEEAKLVEAMCKAIHGQCTGTDPRPTRVKEIRTQLLSLFREDRGGYLSQLATVNPGESERVRGLAHAIGGAAATCGLEELAKECRTLETAAREGWGEEELRRGVEQLTLLIAAA